MHFLHLCILSSTAIFVTFKTINRFHIPAFPVIVINYLVATLLGLLIYRGDADLASLPGTPWLPISIIIGIMFILMFFLMAWLKITGIIPAVGTEFFNGQANGIHQIRHFLIFQGSGANSFLYLCDHGFSFF